MAVWGEQLQDQPWVTDAVFTRARNLIITLHADKYLPPFAAVLDYCHQAKAQLDREAEQQAGVAALKALPAPDDPHALTEAEVADVVWIRNWYARTLSARKDVEYLNERMDAADLAFQRECERFEDVIGHIPDLPPEQLTAALRSYHLRGRQPIQDPTPR